MYKTDSKSRKWKRKTGCVLLAAVLFCSMLMAGCRKQEVPDAAAESRNAAAESANAAAESTNTAANNADTAAESIAAATEEESKPESAGAISAEKTVLLDTDIVQLTLIGAGPFSVAKDDGTTKTADPEVEVSFEVTNKGQDEIILDLRDLKVGENAVGRILLEGSIAAPGETQTFRYGILPKEANGAEDEAAEETANAVSWEMVSQQGLSGTVRVMNIEGELAQAEFSTAG